MARRLFNRIAEALRVPEDDTVHFHSDSGDRPTVCYDGRCTRPRLSID
jgi:hypothetical protein